MARLQRRKLEGQLTDVERLKVVLADITKSIQERVAMFHRQFGAEAAEMLNEIVDEARADLDRLWVRAESGVKS